MTTKLPLPAGLVILTLAACGAVGAATLAPDTSAVLDAPALRCELIVAERAGQVWIEGRVQSEFAASGAYALRIASRNAGNLAVIAQDGAFTAAAGQVVTLGQASLSGRAADLDTTLTLEWQGDNLICPVVPGV